MKLRLLFLILFGFTLCFSQKEEVVPPISRTVIDSVIVGDKKNMLPADSILIRDYSTENSIYPKNFDPNYKSKYKAKEFDYTTIKPHESLWERMKRRIEKFLESVFGKINTSKIDGYTGLIIRILAIAIVGFLLYFIIKYVLSKDGNLFFSKKNKKLNVDSGDVLENIHEINFTQSISNFERQKDFRSAIRYRFLQTLKILTDKKMIEWNTEKTNQDYIIEIKDKARKQKFKELAYIFDYVWYGEFDINEFDYNFFKNKFENLDQ